MLPNLYRNRHGNYYLRVTLAGREVKRSLRTKEPSQAKLAAIAFAWARLMDMKKPLLHELPMGLDPEKLRELGVPLPSGARITDIESDEDARRVALMLQALDAGASAEEVVARAQPLPGIPAEQRLRALTAARAASAGRGRRFSKVAEMYLAEKKLDNSRKTQEDKKATYAAFKALHGDMDFEALGSDHALAWKQGLLKEGLSADRINTRLSHLKELFLYALNNGLRQAPNPFERMRVSNSGKMRQGRESYEPFDAEELAKIFDPNGYPAYMSKPDYKWLPFLALHTGARLEELASLEVDQVRQTGAIWWLDISKGKNRNSIRKVPLHKAVEASGFLAYAQGVRAMRQKMLFPHLKGSKNGYSKNCSRRFGQWLDQVGITHAQKVFHSFRATFITRMSELNTHPAMLMALVGHHEQSRVDLSSPHFQNYQGAKLLTALKETIDHFDLQLPMQF